MAPSLRLTALLAALILSAAAQVREVNVSRDLVALGIASRNADPDTPSLDARPLFQAAIAYARDNGIPLITAEPGGYWFLTPQTSTSYLLLDSLNDLTLDLQGADIYLGKPFMIGFEVRHCSRVTLANFSLDFSVLPFTQVRLTGVSARTLAYETLPGWPSANALAALRTSGATEFWGLVFRNGSLPPSTNRLPLARPHDSGVLQVNVEDSPWTQPGVLATYQPGDIIVITARAGPAPVLVAGGESVTLSGIDIYASGSLGVHFDSSDFAAIEGVHVLPRPGSDRLISTNADGIHMSFAQLDSRIRDCYVSRTMDDGIALNSPFLATVDQLAGSRDLRVRNLTGVLEPGYHLAFVNPATGVVSGNARLVRSTSSTLTFDSDLPDLRRGFGVIYSDPPFRGEGTIVENNIVEDVLFARGIFLGGVAGVKVRKNTVRGTNGAGIAAHYELSAYPTGPNQDLEIVNNTVDAAIGPAAVGTGWVAATGAIAVLATDSSFQPIRTAVMPNITVTGNFVANSGRTAIWINGVDGGALQNNTIATYGLYPQLAIWGTTLSWAAQLSQDFAQPVVVRFSRNITVQNPQ